MTRWHFFIPYICIQTEYLKDCQFFSTGIVSENTEAEIIHI